MRELPILMTADYWMNSQFSLVRFSGGITINGYQYVLAGQENDLIQKDWLPIYNKLGRKRTIGLINNGTSLKVAKQIINTTSKKNDDESRLF